MIENVALQTGLGGTARCHAINQYVFEEIRRIKPDVLFVGAYFAQFLYEWSWLYPDYLDAFYRNVQNLRKDGIPSIIIAGQVPTWSPSLPILVGRDVLAQRETPEFTRAGLRPDGLATDALLSAKDWGEGVTYISQVKGLCQEKGCRRLVGPNLPDDVIAVDYGHYSREGSIFAVKTMFVQAYNASLEKAAKR